MRRPLSVTAAVFLLQLCVNSACRVDTQITLLLLLRSFQCFWLAYM